MKRFAQFIAVALAVLGGGAIYFPETRPETTAEPAVVSASAMPVTGAAPLNKVDASGPVGIQARFENASNYAAFIHDAMQRPEEGGRFYALLAYLQCQEYSSLKLPADAVSNSRRESAIKEALSRKQRCASVAAQFPSEVAFMSALKYSNARGIPDKLLPASGLFPAQNLDHARKAIGQALGSGAPYLVAAVLEVNIDHLAHTISPAFDRGANRALLYRAAAAASCEIAGTCDNSFRVLAQCAGAGDCEHTDLRALLRDGLDAEELGLYELTRLHILEIAGSQQKRGLN